MGAGQGRGEIAKRGNGAGIVYRYKRTAGFCPHKNYYSFCSEALFNAFRRTSCLQVVNYYKVCAWHQVDAR